MVVVQQAESNSRSAGRRAERRAAIVAAAIAVFLEKGFHGCAMRDIAGRAGMTQGNIYNYVRSKADILYLVCDQAVGQYSRGVEEALASTADPGERLVRAVGAMVAGMYERRHNILIVYRENHSLDAPSRRAILKRADSFVALMKVVIAAAVASGHAVVDDVDLAAATITYVPTIYALRGWRLRGASREASLSFVSAFILAGLGAKTHGPTSAAVDGVAHLAPANRSRGTCGPRCGTAE